MKIQWLRSFKDAYHKFLASAADEGNSMMKGLQMPYFYVRNNTFVALFRLREDGKPQAILSPSQTLAKVIQECKLLVFMRRIEGIAKTVVNIVHEVEEEEDDGESKKNEQVENEEDIEITDHDRLTFLLDDNQGIHQDNQARLFNYVQKNQSQLYYFDNKAVQSVYRLLQNYVASALDQVVDVTKMNSMSPAFAQVLAPQPFINCSYNECQTFYKGRVSFANKQTKYQLKLYGVFFPQSLARLCPALRAAAKTHDDDGLEIEVTMRSEEQSKLFSFRKCIKTVRMS